MGWEEIIAVLEAVAQQLAKYKSENEIKQFEGEVIRDLNYLIEMNQRILEKLQELIDVLPHIILEQFRGHDAQVAQAMVQTFSGYLGNFDREKKGGFFKALRGDAITQANTLLLYEDRIKTWPIYPIIANICMTVVLLSIIEKEEGFIAGFLQGTKKQSEKEKKNTVIPRFKGWITDQSEGSINDTIAKLEVLVPQKKASIILNAQSNRMQPDWSEYVPGKPEHPGPRTKGKIGVLDECISQVWGKAAVDFSDPRIPVTPIIEQRVGHCRGFNPTNYAQRLKAGLDKQVDDYKKMSDALVGLKKSLPTIGEFVKQFETLARKYPGKD